MCEINRSKLYGGDGGERRDRYMGDRSERRLSNGMIEEGRGYEGKHAVRTIESHVASLIICADTTRKERSNEPYSHLKQLIAILYLKSANI